ncbi:MAG TPA: organomercurial lyase [Candidatus Limnocylindrales bacterium]|nr:organomercurial lyase [Candidatus Limnocylindrales bacterium]
MTVDPELVRVAVYRALASTGAVPDAPGLAVLLGASEADVPQALEVLHDQRHLVLRDGRIVLAHPFATIDLGWSVKGRHTLWWGGCVWDSFAIPHLVPDEPSVLVATTCPGCERAHAWTVTADQPPEGDQVAHFPVPMARVWDDVVATCGNQRVFCGEACLERWLASTGRERGYSADLATAWRLASRWYAGRLEPGYRRREPAEAAAYFASVGLRGPFWGLPPTPDEPSPGTSGGSTS